MPNKDMKEISIDDTGEKAKKRTKFAITGS